MPAVRKRYDRVADGINTIERVKNSYFFYCPVKDNRLNTAYSHLLYLTNLRRELIGYIELYPVSIDSICNLISSTTKAIDELNKNYRADEYVVTTGRHRKEIHDRMSSLRQTFGLTNFK